MQELDVDVPDHKVVDNFDDASKAVHDIGVPVVMKTTRWDYDGKRQRVVHSMGDVADAFEDLSATASGDTGKVIVEKCIDFESDHVPQSHVPSSWAWNDIHVRIHIS